MFVVIIALEFRPRVKGIGRLTQMNELLSVTLKAILLFETSPASGCEGY